MFLIVYMLELIKKHYSPWFPEDFSLQILQLENGKNTL